MQTNNVIGAINKTNFNKNEMTQTQAPGRVKFKKPSISGKKIFGGVVYPFTSEMVEGGTFINKINFKGTIRGATPLRATMANALLDVRVIKVPNTAIMKDWENFYLQKDNQRAKPDTIPFYSITNNNKYQVTGNEMDTLIYATQDESNIYEYCTINGQFLPTLPRADLTNTENYSALEERSYKLACNELILNKEYQTLYRIDNENVVTETENYEYQNLLVMSQTINPDEFLQIIETRTTPTTSDGKIIDCFNNILCRMPKMNNYYTNYRKEAIANDEQLSDTKLAQTQEHQTMSYGREMAINISTPVWQELARIGDTVPAKDDRVELIAQKEISIPYYQQEGTSESNLGETGGWIFVDFNIDLWANNFSLNQHSIILVLITARTENIPANAINISKKKFTANQFYQKELTKVQEDAGLRRFEINAKLTDQDTNPTYLGFKRKYNEIIEQGNILFNGALRPEIKTTLARGRIHVNQNTETLIEEDQSNWHFADSESRQSAILNMIDFSDVLFSRNSKIKNEFPLAITADCRGISTTYYNNEVIKDFTKSSGEPQFIVYGAVNWTFNEPINPEIKTQESGRGAT